MKIAFLLILLIHGLIHLMGFVKALGLAEIEQLSRPISKPLGWVWLLTALLFMATFLFFLLKKEAWPALAIMTIIISQILIFTVWTDAKYGTIANMIILLAAVIGWASINFENSYEKDVRAAMQATAISDKLITEKDLEPLPEPVQKYLRYVGVVGKPKIYNVKIEFEGEMRDRDKDWFKFTSEQYNFFDSPTRLFFMKAKVNGLPTNGFHRYKKKGASMHIKVLCLIPVVDIDKPELFKTETVTFFNDLCLFAPAALIDKRVTWETLDDTSAKATFKTNNTSISAFLYFNEKGQLVNFISEDRISVDEMKTYPFSTPASNYKNMKGYNLATHGEAIWHYPDEEFVYGKFDVKSVQYNVPN